MHRIAFVVFPNFQVMGFAAITVFEVANRVLADIAYDVTLLSETGGLVRSTAGFGVETAPFGSVDCPVDRSVGHRGATRVAVHLVLT